MFRGYSITPRNFCSFVVLFLSKSEGRGSVPADAVASPRRWTISRRPLVLSAGGNTILFRLLTKPLFCSFPPLDAHKGFQWRFLIRKRGGFGGAQGIEQNISCFVQSVPSKILFPGKLSWAAPWGAAFFFCCRF